MFLPLVSLALECLASMFAFFRVLTLCMGAVPDCALGPMARVVLQSEGVECRHSSLMHVLVCLALLPAQHSPALDFHERASVCLSAGFAVLRLGHMQSACLCVREHALALGQTCARVSRAHACFLSRAHVWCECCACLCAWPYGVWCRSLKGWSAATAHSCMRECPWLSGKPSTRQLWICMSARAFA